MTAARQKRHRPLFKLSEYTGRTDYGINVECIRDMKKKTVLAYIISFFAFPAASHGSNACITALTSFANQEFFAASKAEKNFAGRRYFDADLNNIQSLQGRVVHGVVNQYDDSENLVSSTYFVGRLNYFYGMASSPEVTVFEARDASNQQVSLDKVKIESVGVSFHQQILLRPIVEDEYTSEIQYGSKDYHAESKLNSYLHETVHITKFSVVGLDSAAPQKVNLRKAETINGKVVKQTLRYRKSGVAHWASFTVETTDGRIVEIFESKTESLAIKRTDPDEVDWHKVRLFKKIVDIATIRTEAVGEGDGVILSDIAERHTLGIVISQDNENMHVATLIPQGVNLPYITVGTTYVVSARAEKQIRYRIRLRDDVRVEEETIRKALIGP